MLKKCFGIISYFPPGTSIKTRRVERLNGLFNRLNELWPDVDIVLVAQNWGDYEPPAITNNIIVKKYDEGLGIKNARNALRNEILSYGYDYVIMLDDDASIACDNDHAAEDYMAEIDKHPGGFCFIHSEDHWHTMDDYARAPLNLCAVSREIYEKEPFPDVVLEKSEALEDDIYAVLLHIKYADKEFLPPTTIRHTHNIKHQYIKQYTRPDVCWPSTWFNVGVPTQWHWIAHNTAMVLRYIVEHKDLTPENLKELKECDQWRP